MPRSPWVGLVASCTIVAALVDTNVIVYRFDARFPDKQAIADGLLREGVKNGSLRLSHQTVLEFVAATTRPQQDGASILPRGGCAPRGGGPTPPVRRALP